MVSDELRRRYAAARAVAVRSGFRDGAAGEAVARRGRCAFRQTDVTRAIKAARAAGVENPVVRLTDATGLTITIEAASAAAPAPDDDDGIVL